MDKYIVFTKHNFIHLSVIKIVKMLVTHIYTQLVYVINYSIQ